MPEPSSLAIINESPDQLTRVSDLFNAVFAKNFTPRIFQWKYRLREYGRIFAVCTWDFERNELVGHVAAVPLKGWMYGREILFFQFVDAMVHEKARGRNLLTKMIHKMLDEIAHFCDNFVPYVFPGPVSGLIGQKHGWLHVVTKIEDIRLEGIPGSASLSASAMRFRKDEPEERVCNRLWEKLESTFPCLLRRDWEFVKWRYLENPAGKYDFYYVEISGMLIGWFVTGFYEDGLRLIDYFIRPKWIKPFFTKIRDFFGDIKCWIPPFVEPAMKGIELARDPTPLTLAVVTTGAHMSLVPVLKRDLFFTMADIDIY